MKKVLGLTIVFIMMLMTCDVYPQKVTVKTTYTTPSSIDSCYMLVWKGAAYDIGSFER